MPSVSIDRLIGELEGLYVPPSGAVATFRKMRQVLREFAAHAGAKRATDLTAPAIGRWLAAFPARTPATSYTLLSSFRRACSYAVHCGYLRTSPFEFRRLSDWIRDYDPRERKAARHHPLGDLKRAFAGLADEAARSWEAHRLFALAATTALTGARALEVQASRRADYDLRGRAFQVRPNERRRLKTKKSRREVVLPGELLPILERWLPEAGSEWAFPGARRRTPWMGGAPGRKPLDRLKAAGERFGVEGLTFQSLRHSYVTHSQGPWRVPDLLTQQLCGHTRRETTEGYRGFDRANALEAVAGISLGLAPPKGRDTSAA